ncbi:protein [Lentinula edodes]|uniref:Protein n=1 Tax=Lentinula edodes TaxID=5353 RepID=A0A1Q3ESF7_LENED|nr:protein [Lentinula edodes]
MLSAALVTLLLSLSTTQANSSWGHPTNADPFSYDPGFDIKAVATIAKALPSHSWEYGTATEALLELYNSSYSVFGSAPFPVPFLVPDGVPSLSYAAQNIVLGSGANGLSDGDGATSPSFGQIGSVDQCGLYRQALKSNLTSSVSYDGLWEHIVGPQSADFGLWGTGNGWASAGMTRVLATVINAPSSTTYGWKDNAVRNLTSWIQEIVDGAMGAPMIDGLLRNYLNDTSSDRLGFGDISSSSLIASVAYRMAVLQPQTFGSTYIQWAEGIRTTLGGNDSAGNPHVTSNGTVTPAVNPLNWYDTTPYTAGSPEGNNFVVLLYTAWRDCIIAGVCSQPMSVGKYASECFLR